YPYRTDRDFAAIEHIQRARISRRHHDVLVEVLEARQRLVDGRLLTRVVRTFFQLVRHARTGFDPAHDESDARHAALDAVVTELLGILLHPFGKLAERLRRGLDQIRVVRKRDLTVEHRQYITIDVRAKRVLCGI